LSIGGIRAGADSASVYEQNNQNNQILYVSDLDGTLLDGNAKLSQKTLHTLNSVIKEGVSFTIATGRTPLSTSVILAELTLELPQILMNGAIIQSPCGTEVFYHKPISQIDCDYLSHAASALKLDRLVFFMKDHTLQYYFKCEGSDLWERFFNRNSCNIQDIRRSAVIESSPPTQAVYAIYIDDKPERLAALYQQLYSHDGYSLDYYNDSYDPGTWCLEVYSASASKKTAARILRGLTKAAHIIGFGDSRNDIPLFSECDECYAVSNAQHEVKQASTAIIGSNHEDAVAGFIANRHSCSNHPKCRTKDNNESKGE